MKISRREFLAEIFLVHYLVAVSSAMSALSGRVSELRQRVAAYWSQDFRSFMRNLSAVLSWVLMMACGAFLYSRWESGKDVGPVLLSLSIIAVGALFRKKHWEILRTCITLLTAILKTRLWRSKLRSLLD